MAEGTESIITFVISLLLTGLAIHVASGFAIAGKRTYGQAVLTALAGSVLAGLVLLGAPEAWGIYLAVAAWALIAAVVYRTSWLRGALIGVLAWILWAIVAAVVRALS